MKQWPIILIAIIVAIVESTLFNFTSFRVPLTLCLLLFLISRERSEQAIMVALVGGLLLDLLSDFWFGAHIFYFGATLLILTKGPYDFQAVKTTFFGFLVFFVNIFILLEISNLMNYRFVVLSSLGIAFVMSSLVFIFLKTKLYLHYEHIQ